MGEGTLGKALADFVRAQWNRQFSWDDVKRIRKEWKGPLVIKGVMYVDYARLAREASADGIVVSIHDGRQFDISPTTMDVLEEIASTP